MNTEQLMIAGFGVMVSLQGWILLSIVGLRERVTKVETKIEICQQAAKCEP